MEKAFEDWYKVAEDVWRYPKKQKKSDAGPRWELCQAGREYIFFLFFVFLCASSVCYVVEMS